MNSKINLVLLLLLAFSTVHSQDAVMYDSTKMMMSEKPGAAFNSYMVQNMTATLAIDSSFSLDTIKTNGFVYYIKHNEDKNAETQLNIVYKVGYLLEDSTKRASAFFTANYISKYYEAKINKDFTGNVNSKVNVDVKPEFTNFVFNITATDENKKTTISNLLKLLADSIPFNSTILEANKTDFVTRYKTNFYNELAYRNSKMPTAKYLNAITAAKLKQFYKDWYRPNLMSVIVAGDLDVAQIQKEIKADFSKLKNPLKEKKVAFVGLSKTPSLLYSVVIDSSITDNALLSFYYKVGRTNRGSITGYAETVMGNLTSIIINKVFDDYNREHNVTKLKSTLSYVPFAKNIDALELNATCTQNYADTLTVLMLDFENDFKAGEMISEKELAKAKAIYLNNLEKYKVKNTQDYINSCLKHFIYNIPIVTDDQERVRNFIEKLDVKSIGDYMASAFKKENIAIVVRKPAGATMLFNTKTALLKKYEEIFPKK
ncbi:MAG: insulinase family protein [Chitinophagales bacterium]